MEKYVDGAPVRTAEREETFTIASVPLIDRHAEVIARRQAEEALRVTERHLREAQNLAKMGRWEHDLVTDVLSWSEYIYTLFETDDVRPEGLYEYYLGSIHPEDRHRVDEAYLDSLTKKTPYNTEYRILMKDGRVKWVMEVCRNHYDADGVPVRSVGIIQDITERKKASELEEKIGRLRREYEIFMRHEIKNILSPIKAYSDLLLLRQTDNLTEKQKTYLTRINDSIAFAITLLDSLKKLQDIENSRMDLLAIPIDLAHLLPSVVREISLSAGTSGVSIDIRTEAHRTVVLADPGLFPGVLHNILKNACEHVADLDDPAQKTVEVSLSNEGESLVIAVTNRGEPLPEEKIATFFDKFNTDRSRKKDGMGLGTTYAYLVTKAHNGSITVTSAPGTGTTVTITMSCAGPRLHTPGRRTTI